MGSGKSRTNRTKNRPYRTLPVLLRSGARGEGAAIVQEISGELGVVLFSTLRDIMLWLSTPLELRQSAFSSDDIQVRKDAIANITGEPTVRIAVEHIIDVITGPVRRKERLLAHHVLSIADWALEHRLMNTELAFVQAAAVARSLDPKLALRTGRLARDQAEFARAETWFRQASKTAKRLRLWDVYADASRAVGSLYLRTGNFPSARAAFTRTLQTVRRYGLTNLLGAAHHDLFLVAAQEGQVRQACEHAILSQKAFVAIPDEGGLARLAGDVGQFWIALGVPTRAVPIFERLAVRTTHPTMKALWQANLARAAALANDRDRYLSARTAQFDLSDAVVMPARLAECYALFALAHLAMRDWELATAAAQRALEIAEAIGAGEIRIRAEEVLEQAGSGVRIEFEAANRASESLFAERLRRVIQDSLEFL